MNAWGLMELGELIGYLKRLPKDAWIQFDFGGFVPATFDSYRGYYEYIALGYEKADFDSVKVGGLLADAEAARGKTFQGYKGGDYRMHAGTPVWVANYGCCGGTGIVGIKTVEGSDGVYGVYLETRLVDP